MTGPPAVLVTKSSATHCRPGEDGPEHMCAINRTHSELVKFSDQDHEYDKVLLRLKGLARRAVQRRGTSGFTDSQQVEQQRGAWCT